MKDLLDYINDKNYPDRDAMELSRKRWDSIAKPLYSLGKLEKAVTKLCGIYKNIKFSVDKRCVVVFCSDNGICEEGVTQTSSDVTAVVAESLTKGNASVNHMSKVANADVIPVDVGMLTEIEGNILNRKLTKGTYNFTKQPAMDLENCKKTIVMGIELVKELKEKGYKIIATGEMGIGNTTTSSAIASVLLGIAPENITGVGAGLSSVGLLRKVSAIERGIEKTEPNSHDALDVLHKLGGYDIAAMVGVYIGGMVYDTPIIIDGFISSVAALVAYRLCPITKEYMMPSHASNEPGGRLILKEIGVEPFIDCHMCLGEGTGAVAVLPILDMAVSVFKNMSTFDDIKIENYKPLT